MNATEVRGALVEFFERDIVGPAMGAGEVLDERPALRYSAGVLFPQEAARNESSEIAGRADDDGDADAGSESDLQEAPEEAPAGQSATGEPRTDAEDVEYDDTVTLANSFKPAAMGLTFACAGETQALSVEVTGARYERFSEEPPPSLASNGAQRQGPQTVSRWQRVALEIAPVLIDLRASRIMNVALVPGLALHVVVRRSKDGPVRCTATVFNTTKGRGGDAFFQMHVAVRAPTGEPVFVEHRKPLGGARDPEEVALALLYRTRCSFAVGHGCAATWDAGEGAERASVVETAVLPAVRVPPVLPTSGPARWMDMSYLATAEDDDILDVLSELPDEYEQWIGERTGEVTGLEAEFSEVATRHLEDCREAARRVRRGIATLRDDAHAMRAFKLMNLAMLQQQFHSRLRREMDDEWEPLPESYRSDQAEGRGFWRKFQVAFILMTLPGLVPDSPDEERDLVDLIWFPTGGGKTEAYLGAAAFALFRRRLADPDDAGCTVLMRYTLRLLTAQQFQRASSLICACELLRQRQPERLGTVPITIGLWVGDSLTPNHDSDAKQLVNRLARDSSARNKFQLLSCPWCGTRLDDRKRLGYIVDGGRMRFRCPSRDERTSRKQGPCPFSHVDSTLPVSVVDDTVYREPPSFLIGTVDKFAMLAWRPEARALFGGEGTSPPALIIQDELHLISGPLGSMVGLYEGVIDLLCQSHGRGPKIIASTATIRRAQEQCRNLFDRDVAQFPPPGLSAADSYFAKEESNAPGRVYVGFLPTAASSALTAQVRAVAALLQGVFVVTDEAEADPAIDPYWTLVQYFSSLKELGRAATLVSADIPDYLPSMYRRYRVPPARSRRIMRHEELTSRKREEEISKILEELERKYRRGSRRWEQALDTLLATNMISVGVDVDRLGLMMVVTQPKGTAEYIQASSRVGRSRAGPGLVLTLYNAGRPRDRSHYEQFRSYHEAFYRYVEPTSVTPFSIPALRRALHAVMVIAARHFAGALNPAAPPTATAYEKALAFLAERVARIDPDHSVAFDDRIRELSQQWSSWAPQVWGKFGKITEYPLMVAAGVEPPSEFEGRVWPTPTSMRNVDIECAVAVVPYPEDE